MGSYLKGSKVYSELNIKAKVVYVFSLDHMKAVTTMSKLLRHDVVDYIDENTPLDSLFNELTSYFVEAVGNAIVSIGYSNFENLYELAIFNFSNVIDSKCLLTLFREEILTDNELLIDTVEVIVDKLDFLINKIIGDVYIDDIITLIGEPEEVTHVFYKMTEANYLIIYEIRRSHQ